MKKKITSFIIACLTGLSIYPAISLASSPDAGIKEISSGNSEAIYETNDGTLREMISVGDQSENDIPDGVYSGVFETTPIDNSGIMTGTVETTPSGENSAQLYKEDDLAGSAEISENIYNISDFEAEDEFLYSLQDEAVGIGRLTDRSDFDIWSYDVIAMVMPVIKEHTFDFTMDPQNLLSRLSNEKDCYDGSSLYFKHFTDDERPVFNNLSEAAIATNKSSVPVLLNVELHVENEYDLPIFCTEMENVKENN
ncbi:MAG: hypothetical protein IKQ56_08520, partial [Lachnospiraceae bacterium]|nr:hypothetical protein [Lachnospiraceae bacterium]